MSTNRRNYGPYHTSLGIRVRTRDELLKPIQAEVGGSLAAIADDLIHVGARVQYPHLVYGYFQREEERRHSAATEHATQTEEE